jgi:hypothetical protein
MIDKRSNNCLSGNVEHRCHAIITADQRKFPNDLSAHLWCLSGTTYSPNIADCGFSKWETSFVGSD